MEDLQINSVEKSLQEFEDWLQDYGETSYDHQSFFAGHLGGRAKSLYYKKPSLGIIAVAPMIFCEAFIPSARQLYWRKLRFPIADAHYAMGFAYLAQLYNLQKYYDRAVHFLNVLIQTRSQGYEHHCWGYPFNWVTRDGILKYGIPLITTVPYVYEAFEAVHHIDNNDKWLEIMHSIAEHAINDIKDFKIDLNLTTCAYGPHDNKGGVINASAYRAFLLTSASIQFKEDKYWQVAESNLNFVLQYQQPNGCWYYAMDSARDFVDHFHTCFVMKALAKIERLKGHNGCKKAIEKGIEYYIKNLFDEKGLPKPFSRPPRLTVYKRELYDNAECINLAVLLKNRFDDLDKILINVLKDLLNHWQKRDGSFRSRKLYFGWDNVPMHRWAQAQMFRSLCFLLYKANRKS